MNVRRYTGLLILIVISVAIKVFSFFPGAVEKYYSRGAYPVISRLLRILFGWIPFSIGDFFYTGVFIWLIVVAIKFFKKLFRKQLNRKWLSYKIGKIIRGCLVIYIAFNILWGLNYDREGVASQLQLQVQPYGTGDLKDVLQVIADRLNELYPASTGAREALHKKSFLFAESARAYKKLSAQDDFFGYASPSVKPSIFSYFGDYLGFTGYYNPFSGEAQVNTTVPVYIQPFTTCHEIGHQLGYAKENEANFVGYLAAKSSDDPAFRYSVYFDLYVYAAAQLYIRDSALVVPIREHLNPGVKNDFRLLREFFKKYENPLEPYIRVIYGRYLKANSQPNGIMTYDEVVASMIAYYKKYGREKL